MVVQGNLHRVCMASSIDKNDLMKDLNRQTAKMPWSDVEKFFAHGSAVFVGADLDLIEVAAAMAMDNKEQIAAWMQTQQMGLVSESQALAWSKQNALLWAVVVAPWVVLQDKTENVKH